MTAACVTIWSWNPLIPCTGLDEALLDAGQRPLVDPLWQYQPPPQIAEVVGQHAQLRPDLVPPEPMTGEPRPMRRLLTFLDPLLGGPALVVKPHDGATGEVEVRALSLYVPVDLRENQIRDWGRTILSARWRRG